MPKRWLNQSRAGLRIAWFSRITGSNDPVRSNQIKPNQTCRREKWTCRGNEADGIPAGQTQSNLAELRKIKGSQESEQIKNGPLHGMLAPPETVKSDQTESNQIKPAGMRVAEIRLPVAREAGGIKSGQAQSDQSDPFKLKKEALT